MSDWSQIAIWQSTGVPLRINCPLCMLSVSGGVPLREYGDGRRLLRNSETMCATGFRRVRSRLPMPWKLWALCSELDVSEAEDRYVRAVCICEQL